MVLPTIKAADCVAAVNPFLCGCNISFKLWAENATHHMQQQQMFPVPLLATDVWPPAALQIPNQSSTVLHLPA